MNSGLLFKRLQIEGWRQFDNVELDLHDRLTVITGANGSGKSTLLSLLNQHFGWSRAYLSVPRRGKAGVTDYLDSVFESTWKEFVRKRQGTQDIGTIYYTNEGQCNLWVSGGNSAQYGIQFNGQQAVAGLFIDSYRPIPIYQPIPSIPMQSIGSEHAYNTYNSELMNKYHGGHTPYSPMFRMKEALISMAVFGEGNSEIGKDSAARAAYTGFNDILNKILPESLGFERIAIRAPDVVLVTKSGDFMIDASSGGITTLIDISWRIYLYSLTHESFAVTLDEPENHLHPSMQRSVMRKLIDAFPNAQFIVASHSPFIVTSVKESNVYVLRYGEGQQVDGRVGATRVYSDRLDSVNRAASAGEILREVLGVPATMPEWVENDLESVVVRFRDRKIDQEMLTQLRSELEGIGFSEYYPEAIASLAANK